MSTEQITVETTTKEGFRTDVDVLKVTHKKSARCMALDGDGVVEQPAETFRTEIPAEHGYAVLKALAEHYDSEVRPK